LRLPYGYADNKNIVDLRTRCKIAGIGCALIALDRSDLMFQYVGTGLRPGKVLGFNVVAETRGD